MYTYEKKDIFCVEIYNKDLADMQKQLFDFLWEKAIPMRIIDIHGEVEIWIWFVSFVYILVYLRTLVIYAIQEQSLYKKQVHKLKEKMCLQTEYFLKNPFLNLQDVYKY